MTKKPVINNAICFHCGEKCPATAIEKDEKLFCCQGCKLVYELIEDSGLCQYYVFNQNPGNQQQTNVRNDKFAFLDEEKIQTRLLLFSNQQQAHVSFYLSQIHCSSCLYLLENIQRFDPGILSAKVDFGRKEVDLVYQKDKTSLRKVAETLAGIGYEPYISLQDLKGQKPVYNKSMIYRLGVAGFCFGNIMLLSFPEYLGIDASETFLRGAFRWIALILSLPVVFYGAFPFFSASWAGLKNRVLNIDSPVALAIIITFIRSLLEVIEGTGSGYFDSLTGIIFFMLAGRIVQEKTYRHLSFERDYSSYFPIAVSLIKGEDIIPTSIDDIQAGDTLLLHHGELIPCDGILTKGTALIDYSFVTGESVPVLKEMGELVYAGGRQTTASIEILVVKEVAQSYLTKLWNREAFNKDAKPKPASFVDLLSRNFTILTLLVAIIAAIYWQLHDPMKIWPAVTSVFIIACPCALLLSSTFTNGNILKILSRHHLYLRNADGIETIAATTHIVFDKTGTLTTTREQTIQYYGKKLTAAQLQQVANLTACSSHPLSKALSKELGGKRSGIVAGYRETIASGIEGFVDNDLVKVGTYEFVTGQPGNLPGTNIFVSFENVVQGYFLFENHYRENISALIRRLSPHFRLSVLSGDNPAERTNLEALFGNKASLLFEQSPGDKLSYIEKLQEKGETVMMIGDGLNDAGALQQSDTGIALTEQTNNFTPASDGILEAANMTQLPGFIQLCRANRKIIMISFAISIFYNITGLYFAVQGTLSPLIAAILMPASSLSIVLLTFGGSNLLAHRILDTGNQQKKT